jgi:hypothetical protein
MQGHVITPLQDKDVEGTLLLREIDPFTFSASSTGGSGTISGSSLHRSNNTLTYKATCRKTSTVCRS